MTNTDLDSRFQEAVSRATKMTQASLPQDVQLRLYAFYKQATLGHLDMQQSGAYHLRDAFKINAWMQISHFTPEEAKENYIEIINTILKK